MSCWTSDKKSIMRPKQFFSRKSVEAAKFFNTTEIECIDGSLSSIQGAQELISMVSTRRTVHKLLLGHNQLGDDGCTALFSFLGSVEGRKYPITYINLGVNGIGERGLLAIIEYLKDNEHLRQLQLQNNRLSASASTSMAFADAVNNSRLTVLSLATNRNLSDDFIENFLPYLSSPHLRELYLSNMNLTPRSKPHIAAYLSSPDRCHLYNFSCNSNSLGLHAVHAIVEAVTRSNYSIQSIEFHANQLAEASGSSDDPSSSSSVDGPDLDEQHPISWKTSEALLSRTLVRNELLRCETGRQALCLLHYARPILLRPYPVSHFTPEVPSSPTLDPPPLTTSFSRSSPSGVVVGRDLPMEIQHYILSFLAPTLSSAQRVRIYLYASSSSTLPPLVPCFCSATFDGGDWISPSVVGPVYRHGDGTRDFSTPRICFGFHGTSVWQRERVRAAWLASVGCDVYELEDGETDKQRVKRTIDMWDAWNLWSG